MNIRNTLTQLISVIIEEAERNPSFANALNDALRTPSNKRGQPSKSSTSKPVATDKSKQAKNRRTSPVLDPVLVFRSSGEAGLRDQLSQLSLEQLRDIVAANRMDPRGLVMSWKTKEKVIDEIIAISREKNSKGDAFFSGSNSLQPS